MAGIVYALVLRLLTDVWVTGWTLLFIAMLFLGGVQLLVLGVIGEYLGRAYGELKRRPLYFVKETIGFQPRGRTDGRNRELYISQTPSRPLELERRRLTYWKLVE